MILKIMLIRGHFCEMDKIIKMNVKNIIYFYWRLSHTHGAKYKEKKVGTFVDVGCIKGPITKNECNKSAYYGYKQFFYGWGIPVLFMLKL